MLRTTFYTECQASHRSWSTRRSGITRAIGPSSATWTMPLPGSLNTPLERHGRRAFSRCSGIPGAARVQAAFGLDGSRPACKKTTLQSPSAAWRRSNYRFQAASPCHADTTSAAAGRYSRRLDLGGKPTLTPPPPKATHPCRTRARPAARADPSAASASSLRPIVNFKKANQKHRRSK